MIVRSERPPKPIVPAELSIEAWKPSSAAIAVRPNHPIASHRQSTAQLRETCRSPELRHQNLPLEAVAAVAVRALEYDDHIPDVLKRRSVSARQVRSPSRHHLSDALASCPSGGLTNRSGIHRQGADDDKNIFNGGAHLDRTPTKLIPFAESSQTLIRRNRFLSAGCLDAADDKEQIENNQVSIDMMSCFFTAISEGFAKDVGCPRASHR
ncbi:hypothetical protein FHW37_108157 [Neorhizobium alkalisoli]|uniref:Uncharacterized protein n=1 Tax=Neorhizobium alkalisoli TaxID=528178 RepID=A0A561QGG9_9HYPH|nr:hypothetical protein FHW37_108157 [Neorhizobium alkalisoli]